MPSLASLVKLEKLKIGEVSGVDSPANELDGWMVLKSREAVAGDDLAQAEMYVLAATLDRIVEKGARGEPLYGYEVEVAETICGPLERAEKSITDRFASLVEKASGHPVTMARHDYTHPDGSGRFAPKPVPTLGKSIISWQHRGAVLDSLRGA